MNCEFSLNLQDLEQILTKSNCSCHFINPNKTRIILWKEVKDGQTTYYLRIGVQKFISYPLTDKNNEVYWRFKPWEKETVPTVELSQKEGMYSELSQKEVATAVKVTKVTNDPDPITKFHQRQAQTEARNNHGNNPEPAVNNSSSG